MPQWHATAQTIAGSFNCFQRLENPFSTSFQRLNYRWNNVRFQRSFILTKTNVFSTLSFAVFQSCFNLYLPAGLKGPRSILRSFSGVCLSVCVYVFLCPTFVWPAKQHIGNTLSGVCLSVRRVSVRLDVTLFGSPTSLCFARDTYIPLNTATLVNEFVFRFFFPLEDKKYIWQAVSTYY